jgi:hypothetical protein
MEMNLRLPTTHLNILKAKQWLKLKDKGIKLSRIDPKEVKRDVAKPLDVIWLVLEELY